jgi:4'-phosphopantetheinyl transferase
VRPRRYLGANPRIEFRRGPRGKPYLAAHGPFFGLSRFGRLALIAVGGVGSGWTSKVRHLELPTRSGAGISRERVRSRALQATRGGSRSIAAGRKEAIKALGEGLSMPLDTFDVSLCDAPKLLACRDDPEHPRTGRCTMFRRGPFVAACAVRAPGLRCARSRWR